MHTPSYIAKGEIINNTSVVIAEPTQSLAELLTNVLDKIGEKKITFKYGIRVQETPHSQRQEVLYILKSRTAYVVCVKVNDDQVMRQIPDLSNAVINSILQRLRLEFGSKAKVKK